MSYWQWKTPPWRKSWDSGGKWKKAEQWKDKITCDCGRWRYKDRVAKDPLCLCGRTLTVDGGTGGQGKTKGAGDIKLWDDQAWGPSGGKPDSLAALAANLAKIVDLFPPEMRTELGLPEEPKEPAKGDKQLEKEASAAWDTANWNARKLGTDKAKKGNHIALLKQQLTDAEAKHKQIEEDLRTADVEQTKLHRAWKAVVEDCGKKPADKSGKEGGTRRRLKGPEGQGAQAAEGAEGPKDDEDDGMASEDEAQDTKKMRKADGGAAAGPGAGQGKEAEETARAAEKDRLEQIEQAERQTKEELETLRQTYKEKLPDDEWEKLSTAFGGWATAKASQEQELKAKAASSSSSGGQAAGNQELEFATKKLGPLVKSLAAAVTEMVEAKKTWRCG